jgi:hypothetical protein
MNCYTLALVALGLSLALLWQHSRAPTHDLFEAAYFGDNEQVAHLLQSVEG